MRNLINFMLIIIGILIVAHGWLLMFTSAPYTAESSRAYVASIIYIIIGAIIMHPFLRRTVAKVVDLLTV